MSAADRKQFFDTVEKERYELEVYLPAFARFTDARGKRVLEIGVGAGTDFVNWVRGGAKAVGIDLTTQGTSLTKERLELEGLRAPVCRADAECLPFADSAFDLVYSYGVLHHSPDTPRAVSEVHRVLRQGGVARVLIYHVPSVVGMILWLIHCAGKLRPWKSPRWAINQFLESPGTKAYTRTEAKQLFAMFDRVSVQTRLGPGDLMTIRLSRRYANPVGKLLWQLYPRWLIRLLGDRWGLGLFVEAVK